MNVVEFRKNWLRNCSVRSRRSVEKHDNLGCVPSGTQHEMERFAIAPDREQYSNLELVLPTFNPWRDKNAEVNDYGQGRMDNGVANTRHPMPDTRYNFET